MYSLVCSFLVLWHYYVGIFPLPACLGTVCRALGSVCSDPLPIVELSAALWLRSEERRGEGGREGGREKSGEGGGREVAMEEERGGRYIREGMK